MTPVTDADHDDGSKYRGSAHAGDYSRVMARVAPYGTWTSPLSATAVAAGGLRLGMVTLDGDDIYWLEGRPSEGGRYALVRRAPDGTIADVTPRDMNVRSRVHEYGGDAYVVAHGVVYFSNFADQRVYRLAPGQEPQAITPQGAWCYADFALDAPRQPADLRARRPQRTG